MLTNKGQHHLSNSSNSMLVVLAQGLPAQDSGEMEMGLGKNLCFALRMSVLKTRPWLASGLAGRRISSFLRSKRGTTVTLPGAAPWGPP